MLRALTQIPRILTRLALKSAFLEFVDGPTKPSSFGKLQPNPPLS
jgi:hypothetical protein